MQGVESQLKSHIQCGKNTGLTDEQIAEILDLTKWARSGAFALGVKNDAYAKYFKGQSYLQPLTTEGVNSANVTFEPGCRNNWHIHHKGGQILLVTSGRGYYQEWGKPAQELKNRRCHKYSCRGKTLAWSGRLTVGLVILQLLFPQMVQQPNGLKKSPMKVTVN